ncbi:hypothetical protein DOY81_004162 [Sarcophaga bullata]|nr:hypothetical protein DOY81_004162 [Sarcophaga bullata]
MCFCCCYCFMCASVCSLQQKHQEKKSINYVAVEEPVHAVKKFSFAIFML